MRILANPVLLRAAVVLFCSTFAFLLALVCMRALRKSITEDAEISSEAKPTLETLPVHLYNTVIQQLKQQQQEHLAQAKAKHERACINEIFSQAVLSTLPCGVIQFGVNGLAKTSNSAAKEILGIASPTGMNAESIFRGAVISRPHASEFGKEIADESVCVADEVISVLHAGNASHPTQAVEMEAEYETPAGGTRSLLVRVSAVHGEDGVLLGAVCVVNDRTELEASRRQQGSQSRISAGTAQSAAAGARVTS